RGFVERVRISLAALTEPGDKVADCLHRRGRIELFLRRTDAFAHPGEIKRLHSRLSRSRRDRSSPSYSPSQYRASLWRRSTTARFRLLSIPEGRILRLAQR